MMTSPLQLEILKHLNAVVAAAVRLTRVSLKDLLARPLPPRELMLGGWLATRNLAMVFAPRGVGKTHFALGVAYAVAGGGSFLKWTAPKARRVLCIDGEMTQVDLQSRLRVLYENADSPRPQDGYLDFVMSDSEPNGIPDLSTEEGQRAIDAILGDAELVVLDNLATLVRNGKENDAEAWGPVQQYLLSLRRRGVSVLQVHHAGKSGEQRGSSAREDVLDAVIRLDPPDDGKHRKGASFRLKFTKSRAFGGKEAVPFGAELDQETGRWTIFQTPTEDRDEELWALHKAGVSGAEIARRLDISAGHVSKIIKRQRLLALDKGQTDPGTETTDDEMPF